jgi:hypothetical protein
MLKVLIIFGAVILRLVPHMPNFAPITALGLFGGAYLSKRFAIIIPLAAMIISDYLLLYISPYNIDFSKIQPVSAMFHTTTPYVWGSFLISSLIGIYLREYKSTKYILGACLTASLQFFLITNFGVWAGGMYSRDLAGLLQSYLMGLPFYQWTVLGDLFYTGVFFGAYEIATRIKKQVLLA